ncbi:MAG: bifunctional methylenetetrahydrofolate dehydrogenase/methenyltetrahydrofolate cyclohydrolase FolD [Alphaproteobacteria bacterium]|nr:MAG: bifunctional methylenetetrahydrofolate dehydrogenase/methenyltetrahydrofolate cyclohydrolase FolD [Alphaproteobacteria bacterium]
MSEAKRIDGKAFAAGLRARVGEAVAELKAAHGFTPGLAVVLVGDDPASQVYVRNKGKMTREAGMVSFEHKLPADTPEAEVIQLVETLNADPSVHGILCQLPLPSHIDEKKVVETIDPAKDVDGLTPVSAGRLILGQKGLVPCTPLGTVMLAKDQLGDLTGLHTVVIGRSILVGKPVAQLFLNENCTVTMAHSRTRDLAAVCRSADILVAAVGVPHLVQGSWVKPGACVLDVGINRVPAPEKGEGGTKLVGDVDFDAALPVAGSITPVPGGIGPMTIACLLRNTVEAACAMAGVPLPDVLN